MPQQLAIAKDFLSEYARLEKPVQRAVQDAIDKFARHTHAGLHLEKLRNAKDPRIRTIRIDRFWRGVVLAPESGDVYCLLRVLPHDEAISYATSRRFTVNQVLGVLESRDEARLETVSDALRMAAEITPQRLFDDYKDSELKSLGIDEQVLPIVRLLTTDAHLEALQHLLPPLQYDALVALASGMTVEEAWEEISKHLVDAAPPAEVRPDDLATAIRRTPDQVALVDGPEELAKMLRPPFALWRIFLHPMQRRIAYHEKFSGAVMVTGGAGTGKTVTALHRAAHLAERYGEEDGAPILMTTFQTPLTVELGRQLDLLIEDPAKRGRVEVLNTDKVAARVVRDHLGYQPQVLTGPRLVALADEVARQTSCGYPGAFLVGEWEDVIMTQDLHDLDAYLEARRLGRHERLAKDERVKVWRAIEALRERMRAADQWSFLQIADEAARMLRASGRRPYRHVIVDEAQDLHPAQWRLLRAAVTEGPDDLFIVGDPHQRIHQYRVSMNSVGIRVSGRSRRLTISYRTTQEILSWAVRILGLAPADDSDEWPDSLPGYESPMHGRRPLVRRFANRHDELDAMAAQVRTWLGDGVEPEAVAVAARTNSLVSEIAARLDEAGIATVRFGKAGRRVQIGTMHSMKGLEFQCVAVVGVEEELMPHPLALVPEDVDPAAHAESLKRERCVLYVACTRARDRLYVSYTGAPSPFLPR